MSIVLNLQKNIISDNANIKDLLREALLIASKLNLSDFKIWINNELKGYPNSREVASYRIISGEVKFFNPYQGWQSIPADITGLLEETSANTLYLNQSIAEIEDLILKKILQTNLDIGIAVDLDWKKAYENRKSHAISEAENILFDNSRNILEIRKNIRNSNLEIGEFLGIIKLSNNGCKLLLKRYDEIRNDKCGQFYDTKSLTKAYLTDMIQELIESKIEVKPILISGKWCEIDTIEDLKRAENMF